MQRLALALSIAVMLVVPACGSSTPSTPDTGGGASDASFDSGSETDAHASDVGVRDGASTDAPASDASREDSGADAASPGDGGHDASANDTGPTTGVGQCSPGRCPPECFRPYRCVAVCGGPVTECGCCPCAPGSIDNITCGSGG